jgi:hypothetical protein
MLDGSGLQTQPEHNTCGVTWWLLHPKQEWDRLQGDPMLSLDATA